jgi:hypothetical protein
MIYDLVLGISWAYIGQIRIVLKLWSDHVKERDLADMRIILKWVSKIWAGKLWTDSSGLSYAVVAYYCEHSLKYGFLIFGQLLDLEEGICCLVLIGHLACYMVV